MINPRHIRAAHRKIRLTNGRKFYFAIFIDDRSPQVARRSRRHFRDATAAEQYGARLLTRWTRIYDAAVVHLVNAPAPAGSKRRSWSGRIWQRYKVWRLRRTAHQLAKYLKAVTGGEQAAAEFLRSFDAALSQMEPK